LSWDKDCNATRHFDVLVSKDNLLLREAVDEKRYIFVTEYWVLLRSFLSRGSCGLDVRFRLENVLLRNLPSSWLVFLPGCVHKWAFTDLDGVWAMFWEHDSIFAESDVADD